MLALSAAGPLEYVAMVAMVLMVVAVLVTCTCWIGKRPSAENLGVPGRIKATNHDEAVITLNGTDSYPKGREDTRPLAPHRELPQIPIGAGDGDPRRNSSAPSDHTSELYAVVADPGARPATAAPAPAAAPAGAANGVVPTAAGRPADQGDEEDQQESDDYYEQPAVARARTERQSSQPPPSAHSRNPSTASSDIPAHRAISGGVPASQELPYMTPPVHRLPAEPAPPAQLHFSGDSVQSADSRGYTRITVREPAAELTLSEPRPADRRPSSGAPPTADNFYATVDGSDDEMYEAIPERRRRAERQPPPPAGEDLPDGADRADGPPAGPGGSGVPSAGRAGSVEPAGGNGQRTSVPPPPSVDSLRQALVHSRQASCSSVASSGGSPPPDRRSARSPLPPLPDLDQLYAKVHKTPRAPGAGSPPPPPLPPPVEPLHQADEPAPPVNYSDFEVVRDPIRRQRQVVRRESSLDPNYESIETRGARRPPDDADDDPEDAGYDRVRRADSAAGAGGGSDDGAGYARVQRPAARAATDEPAPTPLRRREHHYERVRRRRDDDPLYEKISCSPAASEVYDEIRWPRGARPQPQPPSDADAESFYESVRFGSELDTDPNYEMLPAKPGSDTDELYSCIWDRRGAEDPYASIKRSDSPPYESIARPPPLDSDSDSDTIGYESVRAAPSSAAGGSNRDGGSTPSAGDRPEPAAAESPAAATAADLSQLYAKVQKVQRQASSQPTEAAPPVPDALWLAAPSEPDDSGAVVRMDSSSASTSQYTSASEAGTPLLPKRLDDLDSQRRRRSTTSVDSGSVTQSERDELMPTACP
ncbi:splicing factor, arginine/serine-rich 19-like [Amphibalanus amphitrite]|uniref:splicing factor, arginine/serine-rich 19-like n=1 Tax=Amphibalanus amphitrite TaxID=1232801 RepID=UPI001C91D906|nr:splicing factor, arginine/serine-rich 19-like [Amphibalanus amphitrite]